MTHLNSKQPTSQFNRIVTAPLILVIRVYQKTLSPILPSVCKYYPSCSRYAVAALSKHGPVHGTRLMLWRILRCNPWSNGGIDYVPEKIKG